MELYNNYWKLISEELPSKGFYYNKNFSIRIRPLNVQEVKYLSTLCEQNAIDVIDEIVRKCTTFINLDFDELLLADREYLIFWLRANSFSKNNGYELHLKCDKCGKEYTQEVHLAEFPTVLFDIHKSAERTVTLPDCELQLLLRQPTIKDLKKTSKDLQIQTFMRYIDLNTSNETMELLLNNLSALDYSILKNNIDEMFIGFSRTLKSRCETCGEIYSYNIEITDAGLFGTVNVGDVLDCILRICKYTHYQILDTQPWWEVEIMQTLVNKMLEEEKEQLDKENGKMTMSKSDLMKM